MAHQYDLVIIGLGSGGTLAAEFAAGELGLKVAAVERGRIGGDCLWTGCVPSKSLIASAKVAHNVRHAHRYGITAGEPEIDLEAVWGRIKTIQAGIAATDDSPERFVELGVELVEGEGRVTGYSEVTVETSGGHAQARHSLHPRLHRKPAGDSADSGFGRSRVPHQREHLRARPTADVARDDRRRADRQRAGPGDGAPRRADDGARDGAPVGPRDEPELADRLATVLRNEGVDLQLATVAKAVRAGGNGVVVETDEDTFSAAGLVVATGRVSNVESLGLDRFGVPVGPGGVEVDGRNRTLVPNIYVVGDAAAGRPPFTHAAAHDAVLAVRDMFLPGRGNPAQLVPWCTFTDPELAHVGLTAAEARERYGTRHIKVYRHDLAHNDRARADGHTEGMLIIVTSKDRIVGAHALAPAAGELIHELALAIKFSIGIDELSELVHIYPTIAAGVGRMAADRSYRDRPPLPTARQTQPSSRLTPALFSPAAPALAPSAGRVRRRCRPCAATGTTWRSSRPRRS